MRSVVTYGVVVLLVTSMSVDLSVVMQLTPRIKVTSAGIVWKGSSDFLYTAIVALSLVDRGRDP
jgi:hypothetical protein